MNENDLVEYADTLNGHPDIVITGWIPANLVEKCKIEIELTPSCRFFKLSSEIDEIFEYKYDTLKELRQSVEEFYTKYKKFEFVKFNSKNITYKYDTNRNKLGYTLVNSGIEIDWER